MLYRDAGLPAITTSVVFPLGIHGRKESLCYNSQLRRGVAQPGSVLAWGARGREFESPRPDQQNQRVTET
jgi:hypothetical protein